MVPTSLSPWKSFLSGCYLIEILPERWTREEQGQSLQLCSGVQPVTMEIGSGLGLVLDPESPSSVPACTCLRILAPAEPSTWICMWLPHHLVLCSQASTYFRGAFLDPAPPSFIFFSLPYFCLHSHYDYLKFLGIYFLVYINSGSLHSTGVRHNE